MWLVVAVYWKVFENLGTRGKVFEKSLSVKQTAVIKSMGDQLRVRKPSRLLTNLAFHPSGVGTSSISLSGWGYSGVRLLVSGGR